MSVVSYGPCMYQTVYVSLGKEVGLSLGDIVLDGDLAPLP